MMQIVGVYYNVCILHNFYIIIVNIAYNIIGDDVNMATKSFLKDIVIKNRESANRFINALEKAENKKSKDVRIDKKVENITDEERIRKIFSE